MGSPASPLTTISFTGIVSAQSTSPFIDVYTKALNFKLQSFGGIWADIAVGPTPISISVVGAPALNFIFISNNDPHNNLIITLTNKETSTVILNPLGMYLVMGAQVTTLLLTGEKINQPVSYMISG